MLFRAKPDLILILSFIRLLQMQADFPEMSDLPVKTTDLPVLVARAVLLRYKRKQNSKVY
jgi:hypothetical protein